jgi:hypothetical protein
LLHTANFVGVEGFYFGSTTNKDVQLDIQLGNSGDAGGHETTAKGFRFSLLMENSVDKLIPDTSPPNPVENFYKCVSHAKPEQL